MRLLLIDDEKIHSDRMRRRLEIENNQVSVSPDWQTGWTLLNRARYDAVLLHVRLAGAGYDMTDRWPVTTCRVPLLLIVSPDTPAIKAWALESGADDCVGYSVDIRELNARLHALYRRRVGHLTTLTTLRAGDLELHLSARIAYRGGKRIDLLPREYYILMLLMENQGCIVSKKEIQETIWPADPTIKSNRIEVYINYLRNKIDRESAVKLIHTVIGMGYVLRTL